MMHIAFCTDANYFMPCGVAMTSICENHKEEDIVFHIVLTCGKNECYSTDSLHSIAEKYNKKICFYNIKSEALADFECRGMSYISTSAFTRLLLAEIIPQNIGRIIYFDCDVIVDGSLLPMWNTVMPEGCAVAAVRDAFGGLAKQHAAIGTPISVPYVNSGVLLLDLDVWRENGYSAKCAELARNKQYPLLDEDVLNDLFKDRIHLLSFQFNLQTHFFVNQNVNWAVDTEDLPELSKSVNNPIVIHYVSRLKPWNSLACIKREIWQRYYDISPWKDNKIIYTTANQDEVDLLISKLNTLSKYETNLFVKFMQASYAFYEIACKMRHREKIVSYMTTIVTIATKYLRKIYDHNLKKQ